jgi:hypothetical protein
MGFHADAVGDILTLTRGGGATINGNTIWTAGNLTNLNQLSNGPGYITSSGNVATVGGLTPPQFFNNMGQTHGTYTNFNSYGDWGFRYMQGSTNGPGTGASQYYGMTIGLGNEYTNYGSQFYWNRTSTGGSPYVSVRFLESGSWGSWSKIYAGYADSAGSANSVAWTNVSSRPTALSEFTNNLGNYGGWITGVTNISGYAGSVSIPDWRDTSYGPNTYDGNRVNWHFNNTGQNGGPAGDYWGAMQTVAPWSEFNTSHRQMQLWWGGSSGLSFRYAVGSGYTPTGWSGWERIMTSSNAAYAWNMNQYVRTSDSVSFAGGTFGGGSTDQGIYIDYSNYGSGYGRIRFRQDGSNHSTIHSFSAGWQGGSAYGQSSGCINIAGQNGVTFGGWNTADAVITPDGMAIKAWTTPSGSTGWNGSAVLRLQQGSTGNNVYLQFRNKADAGDYAGILFTDNNTGGYIAFRTYTGGGANNGYNGDYMVYGTYTDHIFQAGSSETVNGKTEVFRISANGNVTATGDVTAYSDARVKENILTIDNALEKTLALRGVYYNRTDKDDKSQKMGVIAQEVLKVLPEIVNGSEDNTYSVAYGNMAGLFIEAIKELNAKISHLEAQLASK